MKKELTLRDSYLAELDKILGFAWNDPNLLTQALTHSSYANEHRGLTSNERLEFLGDAVLELIISEHLFQIYPGYPEGDLTRIRAAVVRETSLAKRSTDLKLGEILYLSRGEEHNGGRKRPSILADALEALIGAVYLDQGFLQTRSFIIGLLQDYIAQAGETRGQSGDFKTRLQEIVQQKANNPLNYVLLDSKGPDHCKTFTAGVYYNGELWGEGEGHSKKEAEQEAAHIALEKLSQGQLSIFKGEGNG